MLPRIDANGGRGTSRRDILQSRSGADVALAPLPRLRLLKQADTWQPEELPQQLPPLGAPPPVPHLGAPPGLPPPRKLLRSRGDSNEQRPGSGGQHRRGRGLLRPLDLSGEAHHQPRAPPVLPWASPDKLRREDHEADSAAALQQQLARDRVKEQRRHLRRAAREEEERRHQDDQDRLDRVQRQAGQVEAHRRDLARQAAERQRRLHEDREALTHENEELQSARRERARRYQTPAQIREMRRFDHNHPSASAGSGSEAPTLLCDDVHSACDDLCVCGNIFMPDSAFCRKCGEKRLGGLKEGGPGVRGGQQRAGRAPNAEVQGSRDREGRRSHGGRSRGSAMDRRNNNGRAADHPEPNTSTGVNAAGSKDADAGDRKDAASNIAPEVSWQTCNLDGETNLKRKDFAADLPVRLATALDGALASGELVKTIANVASDEEAAEAMQPSDEAAEVAETSGIGVQPSGHDAEAAEASGTAAENTASDNAPGEPLVATTKAEGMDASDGTPAEAPNKPRGEAAADSASAGMDAAGAEALAEASSPKSPGEAAADAEAVGTEVACAEAPAEAAGKGAPGKEAASVLATVTNEQF